MKWRRPPPDSDTIWQLVSEDGAVVADIVAIRVSLGWTGRRGSHSPAVMYDVLFHDGSNFAKIRDAKKWAMQKSIP